MDDAGFDASLSSSLQTTLAVSGAFALVAGVFIHRHQDFISSLLVEEFAVEEMIQSNDWEHLSIPAQVSFASCLLISLAVKKRRGERHLRNTEKTIALSVRTRLVDIRCSISSFFLSPTFSSLTVHSISPTQAFQDYSRHSKYLTHYRYDSNEQKEMWHFFFVFRSLHNNTNVFQSQGHPEARVSAALGSRPLVTTGKSPIDDRTYSTFYEGFQIGKDLAMKGGEWTREKLLMLYLSHLPLLF